MSIEKEKIWISCSVLFLITSALFFPLQFTFHTQPYVRTLKLFDLTFLSIISAGFILLKFSSVKKVDLKIWLPVLAFASVVCMQKIYFKLTICETFYSLIWITIPLFAFLYFNYLNKFFYIFILFIFSFNCLYIFSYSRFIKRLPGKYEMVGITGNRNMNAAIILFCLFLILPSIIKYMKNCINTFKRDKACYIKKNIILISLLLMITAILVISSYILYYCHSRGAWIVLFFIAIFYLLLKNKLLTYRKTIYSVIILGILFTFVYLKRNNINIPPFNSTSTEKNFGRSLKHDTRPSLWLGALNLFEDNFLLGVSSPHFENDFAEYIPISFYSKPVAAFRVEHPHNIFLYIANSFGIFGLAAWCMLFIYPAINLIKKYGSLNLREKTYLWGYSLLLLLSLIDKTLFAWPGILFGLLTIGFIWKINCNLNSKNMDINFSIPKKFHSIIFLSGILLIIYSFYYSGKLYLSSYYYRQGEIQYSMKKNKINSVTSYLKSLNYNVNADVLYKLSTAEIELKNYNKALFYLNCFDKLHFKNYPLVYYWKGYCFYQLGNYQKALIEFKKQIHLYPLLISGWSALQLTQEKLGLKTESQNSIKNILSIMKAKKLSTKMLPFLLKNIKYDMQSSKFSTQR